jgi:hypothetical protein
LRLPLLHSRVRARVLWLERTIVLCFEGDTAPGDLTGRATTDAS